MGSFNVNCIVTHTPILVDEEARLIVFKNTKGFRDTLEFLDCKMSFIWKYFVDIFKGKYDDYGMLDVEGCPEIFGNDEDKYQGYFVSEQAWQCMLNLPENDRFKLHSHSLFSIAKSMVDLFNMAKVNNPDLKKDKLVKESEFLLNNQETVRGICAIDVFGTVNNFNPWDTNFRNRYAGQSLYIDYKNIYQNLRQTRIDMLGSNDEN